MRQCGCLCVALMEKVAKSVSSHRAGLFCHVWCCWLLVYVVFNCNCPTSSLACSDFGFTSSTFHKAYVSVFWLMKMFVLFNVSLAGICQCACVMQSIDSTFQPASGAEKMRTQLNFHNPKCQILETGGRFSQKNNKLFCLATFYERNQQFWTTADCVALKS